MGQCHSLLSSALLYNSWSPSPGGAVVGPTCALKVCISASDFWFDDLCCSQRSFSEVWTSSVFFSLLLTPTTKSLTDLGI